MSTLCKRIGAIVATAALATLLAACSTGTTPCAKAQAPATTATPTPAPTVVEVYPAEGNKNGVDVHGIKAYLPHGAGLWYTCSKGETSIPVVMNHFFEYDGVTIGYIFNKTRLSDRDNQYTNNPNGEASVTVTFTGPLPFTPISLIVHALNVTDHKKGSSTVVWEDENVVNLSASELTAAGIDLVPFQFTGGYIADLTLCVTLNQ